MYCKVNKYSVACAILSVSLLLFFTSCVLFISPCLPSFYTYRFSIKNETNSDLDIKLAVGEIPNMQSRFDEFTLVPDELYKLLNESWSNETHCIIKPNNHDSLRDFLPIVGLGSPLEDLPFDEHPEYAEKEAILRENLLNRLFSFVLTISMNNEIVYRIAGWDVPDEDMEEHQITGKMFGCYNTAPENYVDSLGEIRVYPLFYSNPDGIGEESGGSFTYYIKAYSDNAFLQEFILYSQWLDDNKYWRKH